MKLSCSFFELKHTILQAIFEASTLIKSLQRLQHRAHKGHCCIGWESHQCCRGIRHWPTLQPSAIASSYTHQTQRGCPCIRARFPTSIWRSRSCRSNQSKMASGSQEWVAPCTNFGLPGRSAPNQQCYRLIAFGMPCFYDFKFLINDKKQF